MPRLSVDFHPDAVEEAQAARQWYAERSQSAADSFLAELDQGIEAISEVPERWPLFKHGLAVISSIAFPSNWSTGSLTTKSRYWLLPMADYWKSR